MHYTTFPLCHWLLRGCEQRIGIGCPAFSNNVPRQVNKLHYLQHIKHILSVSVQELKNKFIVKGKRLNKLDAALNNNSTIDEDTVSEEDEAADCKENGQKPKSKVCQVFITLDIILKNIDLFSLTTLSCCPVSFQKKKIKLAKELSDIVLYCKSVHFSGFEHAKDNHAFYEMSSFKESKAFNLASTSGKHHILLTLPMCSSLL